jgi:hypothetical protein
VPNAEEAGRSCRSGNRPLPDALRPHRHQRRAPSRHGDLAADVRTGETVVRMAGRLTSIRGHGRSPSPLSGRDRLGPAAHAGIGPHRPGEVVLANVDLGRLDRCRGRGDHQPPRRALGRRDRAVAAVQGAAATPRQVARAHRHRHPLPTARGRPSGQSDSRECSTSASRPSPHCAASWCPRTSSRSTPRSCSHRPVGPWPGRS